jgi:ABC-type multidrug transport system fused ATPase/permease subunit
VSGASDDPFDDTVATKAWDSSLAKRLLRFARPHWGLFAGSFVVLGALFALDVLGPWMWRRALDGPVAAASAARAADPAADVSAFVHALWLWIGGYVAVVLLSVFFRYLEIAQLNKTGQVVIADLREQLFRTCSASTSRSSTSAPPGSS